MCVFDVFRLLCYYDIFVLFLFFFFKQKTAYEMRISDWSSDVCSSDLSIDRMYANNREILNLISKCREIRDVSKKTKLLEYINQMLPAESRKIGRASCRERVCQHV